MILKMKNIGRFYKESVIEINGITILGGANGTGKSTIGKVLYCVFAGLYDCDNKVLDERINSIRRTLNFSSFSNRIFANRGVSLRKRIKELIYEGDANLLHSIAEIVGVADEEIPEDVLNRVKDIISASNDDVVGMILRRYLAEEFYSQVGHVNYPNEESLVELKIKDKTVSVKIGNNVSVDSDIQILKDLVYVDDPYVIDELSLGIGPYYHTHRTDLAQKLRNRYLDQVSAVDDVIMDSKLESIYEKLESVCGGSVKEKNDEYFYTDKNLKSGILVQNLSTGIKCFVILKTLLQKGYLEENGIVVLDEPEAHLHPEWMLTYAEIIALLQKELGINFVISTHSSEFLSYLELFTKKYELKDKCKYYYLEEDREDSSFTDIQDCTDDIAKMYEALTRPYIWASKELDSE